MAAPSVAHAEHHGHHHRRYLTRIINKRDIKNEVNIWWKNAVTLKNTEMIGK